MGRRDNDRNRRDDDGDDNNVRTPKPDRGDANDDEGPIAVLTAALELRLSGRAPSPETIASARERAGQDDLTCWNGKSALKPQCHNIGSQNIPPVARAAMGDWRWLARLARVWIVEGPFGKELGSNALLYVVTVLKALLWATGEAQRAGEPAMAEDLRFAVRSAVAFFALSAVPVARRRSVWLSTDKRFPREEDVTKRPESPTAAVSGNRWTIQRGGHDGDAGSVVVRGATAVPADWGLTSDEGALLRKVIAGDVDAAQSIARHVNDGGWMLGTINVPGETVWRWKLERTVDGGASSTFYGPWPNGNTKMVCGYTKIEPDGTWTSAKAWPEGYNVADDDENIVVSDERGQIVVPKLTGERLWTVTVEGATITFEAA